MIEKLNASDIPELLGNDVIAARQWCLAMSKIGILGLHADDGFSDIGLKPDAEKKANHVLSMLFKNSIEWPDPDFIYDLIGSMGIFRVEEDYPGFVVDCSIPSASRTGYESVPRMDRPSVIVEENNHYVLLKFDTPSGRLSETRSITVIPTEGCSFLPYFPGERYISVHQIKPVFTAAVVVTSLEEIDHKISELVMPIGPKP